MSDAGEICVYGGVEPGTTMAGVAAVGLAAEREKKKREGERERDNGETRKLEKMGTIL